MITPIRSVNLKQKKHRSNMNTIIQGDCLEVLKCIPDAKIDAVITDPPYACLNKSNSHAKWDKEFDLQAWWTEIWRVCKENAAVVCFGQGIFSAKLMLSQEKYYRYSLVWDKINPSGFLSCNRMPMRRHEDIMVFYRKQSLYNPQMTYGQKNHARGRCGNGGGHGINRCYGNFKQTETVFTNEKYPTSIVRFAKEKKNVYHGTQKPVALMEWLIRTYSNESGIILDPFIGSGSTGVACVNTKRSFIGIELTDEYYEIAKKRIHDAEIDKKQRLDL